MVKERRVKDFITMDTLLNDKRVAEGFKALGRDIGTVRPMHVRRVSDELGKRPSSGVNKKRRGSVSRK